MKSSDKYHGTDTKENKSSRVEWDKDQKRPSDPVTSKKNSSENSQVLKNEQFSQEEKSDKKKPSAKVSERENRENENDESEMNEKKKR